LNCVDKFFSDFRKPFKQLGVHLPELKEPFDEDLLFELEVLKLLVLGEFIFYFLLLPNPRVRLLCRIPDTSDFLPMVSKEISQDGGFAIKRLQLLLFFFDSILPS
jgi:hypothetical protein